MSMTTNGLKRRRFIQAMSVTAFSPFTLAAPCTGLQEPFGDFPRSTFGERSTADQVTAGLDLQGKTAVITGCNSGLGLESMRVLTERGAHVIGTARTAEKAEKACASMGGKATPVVLELTDFDSARACAKSIRDMKIPLDILMCNAGIMALPELELVNGLEKQFVVNHLGHFLFTTELLEPVKRANSGRIVILSSCAHHGAPEVGIDFDNLDGSKSYSGWTAYGRSKLANGLFAAELSRRLAGTGTTANSLHPGVIKTNLGRHLPEQKDADDDVFNKTIPQGAATQCYVAGHPTPAAISGQYFSDCNPVAATPLMYDEALAKRLWSVSEELVGVV